MLSNGSRSIQSSGWGSNWTLRLSTTKHRGRVPLDRRAQVVERLAEVAAGRGVRPVGPNHGGQLVARDALVPVGDQVGAERLDLARLEVGQAPVAAPDLETAEGVDLQSSHRAAPRGGPRRPGFRGIPARLPEVSAPRRLRPLRADAFLTPPSDNRRVRRRRKSDTRYKPF